MNRLPQFLTVFAAVMTTYCQPSNAQDDDLVVRAAIQKTDEVLVGQRVVLKIDVLARDVWANLSGTPRIDVPGAIVTAPPSSSIRLSEQIRGGSFIGQQYEWWIYPQRQGKFEIPTQKLKVQLKPLGFGKEAAFKSAKTDRLELVVTYPKGVPAGSNLICAREFSAQQTWKPESADFKVGDGITRVISRTVADTPAMILSPINETDITNVKTYVKQPEVADKFDRGDLMGSRSDSVTYVFEQPGKVQLPAIRFAFWNLDAGKLDSINLAGMSLEILPAEESIAETHVVDSKPNSRGLLALIVAIVAAIVLVTHYRQGIANQLKQWQRIIERSEFSHFRRFVVAAKSNDPCQTLQVLMQWLDVASDDPAPRLDLFVNRNGDEQAKNEVLQLEAAVDNQAERWNTDGLVTCMKHAREHWLSTQRSVASESKNPLPPLRSSS